MASPGKIRKALFGATTLACGLLALVLLRWTTTSGRSILVYAAMFALLITMAIILSPRKPSGYWPEKPE
jgi:hypothetical protein